MIKRVGAKRSTRIGLDEAHCKQCAEEKDTDQVVCYMIPRSVEEKVKAAGMIYFGARNI